jgi:hypothetical protein
MTTTLHQSLQGLEIPPRIQALPLDDKGRPVPWFVAWVDGKPEFRAMDFSKFVRAIKEKRCWVCGQFLGQRFTFVIGPMCAINRISSEPPSHLDCAMFSAVGCPFLSKPHMVRRENDLPEGTHDAAGVGVKRNPGVTLLWSTQSYHVFEVQNGHLISVGDPIALKCFFQGREATKDEIRGSIESGLPNLLAAADKEKTPADRSAARKNIETRKRAAYTLLGI